MSSFTIDTATVKGPNTRFWSAIGYDFLFKNVHEPAGQALLDRGKDTGAFTYLRSHFTFNNSSPKGDAKAGGNICGRVMTFAEDGTPVYDFTHVNNTFQEYVKRGMKPIVEFDFFPDGLCVTEEEVANDEGFSAVTGEIKDWGLWGELLNAFMKNLEEVFGPEELKTWYFEVWNEPDHWPEELTQQLYKMYDLFAKVVKSYNREYKIGGPGCYKLFYLKEFLDHVTEGTNYFTGEIGTPLDFVSFHIYSMSGHWLRPAPELVPAVNTIAIDILNWERLMRRYPTLKTAEMHLNEWGVVSHGDTKFTQDFPRLHIRNSEYSALFMVKLIDVIYGIHDDHDFTIDLMLYWGSCFNATMHEMFNGSRDLTTTGNVPKPIFTTWEMLTRLGDDRLAVTGPQPGSRHSVLATRSENQIQLLVYNFMESDDELEKTDTITMEVTNLDCKSNAAVTEYRLDRNNHNTYRTWQALGAPDEPDEETIAALHEVAAITPTDKYSLEVGPDLELKVELQRHSMMLVTIDL
jgi:xylan 1,4-beta-xylosidase